MTDIRILGHFQIVSLSTVTVLYNMHGSVRSNKRSRLTEPGLKGQPHVTSHHQSFIISFAHFTQTHSHRQYTMFSDTTQAIAFGKQFAFQQRAKEVATNGFSKTQIPKTGLKKPPAKDLDPVLNKILFAIEEQEEILQGLSIRIYRSANLATKLAKHNPKMAASTMRKVKSIQQEYVHVLRVKAGTKEYQKHVKLGLQDLKDVEKNLEGLKNCHWNNKQTTASDDALIAQLETEKFFPEMDSQGKISFSKDPLFMSGSVTSSEAFSTTSSTSTLVPLSPKAA
jgi:hypothetical protein